MLSFRTRGNFVDFVHTDNTSLEVESVIMSLHNTSKAVDWSLPEDTTRISFTIDDISYDNILITDIDFDGVTMTAQADFKTNIETIFPGLAGGAGVVETIVAGSGISVNSADPANPIVSASGGGSLSAIVTLTDAQIKTLPTTGVQLVAAPGVGKVIVPVRVAWVADFAGPYTAAADASWQLLMETGYVSSPLVISDFISVVGAQVSVGLFSIPWGQVGSGNFVGSVVSTLIGNNCENQPLIIKDDFNGVANYTGGDAANTLTVTTYYEVLDL